MSNDVIVGLGSNIDPIANIEKALGQIKTTFTAVTISPLIKTTPLGFKDQDDFYNGAVRFKTSLTVLALKGWLLNVENDLGRIRTANKNGPRTIDLDILVWNGEILDKDVEQRDFLQSAIETLQPGVIKKEIHKKNRRNPRNPIGKKHT